MEMNNTTPAVLVGFEQFFIGYHLCVVLSQNHKDTDLSDCTVHPIEFFFWGVRVGGECGGFQRTSEAGQEVGDKAVLSEGRRVLGSPSEAVCQRGKATQGTVSHVLVLDG